jgi:hypothetical protein
MGRLLEKTMSEFSSDDMSVLENFIASNFEDALMIASLSRLQQQQLRISEKLNTVFSETVVKSQQTTLSTTTTPASILKVSSKKASE